MTILCFALSSVNSKPYLHLFWDITGFENRELAQDWSYLFSQLSPIHLITMPNTYYNVFNEHLHLILYGHISFYCASLYCSSWILRSFFQIKGFWQTCVKQAYQCHFSNLICSLHVSLSHFGHSQNNFKLSTSQKIMTHWRLRWWSTVFSNKVF